VAHPRPSAAEFGRRGGEQWRERWILLTDDGLGQHLDGVDAEILPVEGGHDRFYRHVLAGAAGAHYAAGRADAQSCRARTVPLHDAHAVTVVGTRLPRRHAGEERLELRRRLDPGHTRAVVAP